MLGGGLYGLDPTRRLHSSLAQSFEDAAAIKQGRAPGHGLLDMESPVRLTATLILMAGHRLSELHETSKERERGLVLSGGIYELAQEHASALIDAWKAALEWWRNFRDSREERRAA